MSFTRRQILSAAAAAAFTMSAPAVFAADRRVRIAVGDSFELREYRIDDCQRVNPESKPPRAEEMPQEEAPQTADMPEKSEKAENVELPRPAAKENAPRRQDARLPRPRGERPERPPRGDKGEQPPRPERGERPLRPPRKPMDKQRPQPPRQEAGTENAQPPKENVQIIREEKVVDVLEIREDKQKQDLL